MTENLEFKVRIFKKTNFIITYDQIIIVIFNKANILRNE